MPKALRGYTKVRQTLPLLRDRTENDPDEQVRKFAQEKLAQLKKQKSGENINNTEVRQPKYFYSKLYCL